MKKGWTEQGEYTPPPPTESQLENLRQDAIRQHANSLVNDSLGGNSNNMLHIMMRALNRVRKENKGKANAADIAELNSLEIVADKIEAIRAEEARLLGDETLTLADANWPE